MGNANNHLVMEKIQSLCKEQREYLEQYFKFAPMWLFSSFSIQHFDANTVFIKEGEKVSTIYFLIEGAAKATDYRIYGAMYDYMWFTPVKVFGALEVILEEKIYKTTLTTTEPCTMFVINRVVYEEWILQDVNALRMEASAAAHSLLKQTRRERVYLFMQGMDRMAYFFMHYYEQFQRNGMCQVRLTRQDMCDCTGLSVKTINRALVHLEESNCLKKVGNRIYLEKEHYDELSKYMSELVE